MPYIVDDENIELLVGFDAFYDFARANFPESEQDEITKALKNLEQPCTQLFMIEPQDESVGLFSICLLGSTSMNGGETNKEMTVLIFKTVTSLILFLEYFQLENEPIVDSYKKLAEKAIEEGLEVPELITQTLSMISSVLGGCLTFLQKHYEDNSRFKELSNKLFEGK
jgi:hypothetical protein